MCFFNIKFTMTLLASKETESFAEIAEFKRIYTTLSTTFLKTKPKCLVVTSALRGEGKTTIVAGLGSTATLQGGNRVLAVDLNWHRPALHTCFGLNPTFDAAAFREKKRLTDHVQPSGIENLDILTATQPDKKSNRTGAEDTALGTEILKFARDNYDIVVVDAASIFPTNRNMIDPVSISVAADGVAIAVLTKVTPRQQVKRSQKLLETAGAKLQGIIANHWENPLFKATPTSSK